ncbi:MAG: STAS domain-containing protein [Alteromonadaceae bacterium]|nr:STAS domain-containing protein [Alteromonadaceae bacterium]
MLHFNLSESGGSLEGPLTRHTVTLLNKNKFSALLKKDKVVLDLSKVTKVDTAGLAWLIFIIEQANFNSCNLSFVNLSSDLMKLAKLCSVDTFLPIVQYNTAKFSN